jgi:ABC-type uncharacterized transport system ATPase component
MSLKSAKVSNTPRVHIVLSYRGISVLAYNLCILLDGHTAGQEPSATKYIVRKTLVMKNKLSRSESV